MSLRDILQQRNKAVSDTEKTLVERLQELQSIAEPEQPVIEPTPPQSEVGASSAAPGETSEAQTQTASE
jgi:hypothetical protein